jgi:hypothetical protein
MMQIVLVLVLGFLLSFTVDASPELRERPKDLTSTINTMRVTFPSCPTGTSEQIAIADQRLNNMLHSDREEDVAWRARMKFRTIEQPGGAAPTYSITRLDGPEHQADCDLVYAIFPNKQLISERYMIYKINASYVAIPKFRALGRLVVYGFNSTPSFETAVVHMY